ncbi:unnamed protein product [marine sediment metagenome]|uniref:BAG domain-containing protein n=1 Tax=marine sediment metagenome TaxID=412755 RepID=X0XUU2_9ZZZZ
MKREKRLKIKKEKKEKILKEGGVAVALSGPRSAEQKNLFGDKDQIYNTIQAEISIIVAEIGACHDSIGKQEDKIHIRQRRKDNLERAARSIAKMRDEELKKKKEEKSKK